MTIGLQFFYVIGQLFIKSRLIIVPNINALVGNPTMKTVLLHYHDNEGFGIANRRPIPLLSYRLQKQTFARTVAERQTHLLHRRNQMLYSEPRSHEGTIYDSEGFSHK
jgi:hypothetical protein